MIPYDWLPTLADMFTELLTGAAGALFVVFGTIGTRYYKRYRLEKRFPISGPYIAFFEDIQDGKNIVVHSFAQVKQNGSSVSIVNQTSDDKSWTLDGTIFAGGHISGVYSADADYDEGVGSFYLKVSSKSLDGMWSGFDNVNRTTTAGRYWFRRILEINIHEAQQADINDILHTSGNAFGYGYVEPDQLSNDAYHYAIVAQVNDEFAGFCFGELLEANSVPDIIRQNVTILPDDVKIADQSGTLGLLKTLAVRRKFREHGVGTQLLHAAEKALLKRGSNCIIVPAWEVDNNTPIENLLLRSDYAQWLKHDHYWREQCDAKQFECVARSEECRCSVTFYRKGRF